MVVADVLALEAALVKASREMRIIYDGRIGKILGKDGKTVAIAVTPQTILLLINLLRKAGECTDKLLLELEAQGLAE